VDRVFFPRLMPGKRVLIQLVS